MYLMLFTHPKFLLPDKKVFGEVIDPEGEFSNF